MSFRSIMVQVGTTEASRAPLQAALKIASIFNAAIIGVGAEAFDPPAAGYGGDGALVQVLRDQIESDLTEAELHFRHAVGTERKASWISACDYPDNVLSLHARGADLIVAGRPDRKSGRAFVASPPALVMETGVPVLLTPDAPRAFEGRRIVVGWKDSRESRRALADALPFLVRADEVFVLGVRKAGREEDAAGLREVVERLKRHGVEAKSELIERSRGTVADDLQQAAEQRLADLLVAGAYGQSRFREWALGGVTEDLIASASTYVLFSR